MLRKLNTNQKHTDCNYCNYTGCVWMREKYPRLGHWLWTIELTYLNIKKWIKLKIASLTAFDYSQIDNIELDGIDHRDYPDFCNAYISYAEYKGKPMTDKQLDRLNDDRDFVYEQVINKIF